MNLEDDKIEPVTDLGISLDYSNKHNQREALNINPSAGANAGSCVDMTFAATNPLTELVWSPHKGLSFKCADCSFSDWKPALLWGAGPSNTAEMKCSVELLNEPTFMTLEKIDDARAGFIPTRESGDKDKTSNSENMQEMKTKTPAENSLLHKSFDEQDLRDGQRGSTFMLVDLKMAETLKRKENPLSALPDCEEGMAVDIPMAKLPSSDPLSNRKLGTEMVAASQIHPLDRHKPLPSACKEKGKRKIKMSPSGCLPHLEKLESTAENDLQASTIGNIYEPGNRITLKMESAPVIKTDLKLDCDVNPGDNIISSSCSPPSDGSVHKHESKGKGKALSEGDMSGRFSKDEEEDDSYESVESCNSAGIFFLGKRQWSFEQQRIVGGKKAKKIQQTPGDSSSLTKHDSSFMNWISNMMKGFARPPDQDEEARTRGLSLSNPNHAAHENLEIPMVGDIQPLNSRSIGFKSIFQSMYGPNKSAEGMVTGLNLLGEGSAEIELPNQGGATNAKMLTCLDKEIDVKVSKENSNEVFLGNEVAPLGTSKFSSGNFITSQDIVRDCSCGNRNSDDFEEGKGKDATKTSESSLNGHNVEKGETNYSPTLQEKRANDLGYKVDPLRSLWLTRFSARSACSLIKQEVGNPTISRACENAQNSLDLRWDQAALEARESNCREPSHVIWDRQPKNFGFSTRHSAGFRRIKDPTLMHKMSPLLPSMKLKSSEAMASLFARRLDALKNMIPSLDLMDDSSNVTTTCFFCGKKGHSLQNCSEITEPELEDLLRNIKSYDNAEGFPCLCIRCFQLNHWAVMCPNMSQKNPKDNPKCNLKLKEVFTGDGILSSPNQVVMKSNENVIATSGNSEKRLVSEVPKGIFSAIQALRLSRTDILKWMDWQISPSHLDGFFLRLRLGKWEEGPGGTGYYVACITGMGKKTLAENGKNTISVNVGGINCLVKSQYISNHDFLEDELIAWWCNATRGGGKIPSEEDLKMKAGEKKMLGF